MNTVLRSILAVFVGMVVAFASVIAVEVLSSIVRPVLSGFHRARWTVCEHVARYPSWVLAVVVIVYSRIGCSEYLDRDEDRALACRCCCYVALGAGTHIQSRQASLCDVVQNSDASLFSGGLLSRHQSGLSREESAKARHETLHSTIRIGRNLTHLSSRLIPLSRQTCVARATWTP